MAAKDEMVEIDCFWLGKEVIGSVGKKQKALDLALYGQELLRNGPDHVSQDLELSLTAEGIQGWKEAARTRTRKHGLFLYQRRWDRSRNQSGRHSLCKTNCHWAQGHRS